VVDEEGGAAASANELVAYYAEFVANLGGTASRSLKGQVGRISARLLKDGVEAAAIEAAIRALIRQQQRGAHLTVQQLPELVVQAELQLQSRKPRAGPVEPEPERDPEALARIRELREKIGR
jgi:hypothetical protein